MGVSPFRASLPASSEGTVSSPSQLKRPSSEGAHVAEENLHVQEAVQAHPINGGKSASYSEDEKWLEFDHSIKVTHIKHGRGRSQGATDEKESFDIKTLKNAIKEDFQAAMKRMPLYRTISFIGGISKVLFTDAKMSEVFDTRPLNKANPGRAKVSRIGATLVDQFKKFSRRNEEVSGDGRVSENMPRRQEIEAIKLDRQGMKQALESMRKKGDVPFIFKLLDNPKFVKEARQFARRFSVMDFDKHDTIRESMNAFVRDLDEWAKKYIEENNQGLDGDKMLALKIAFVCASPILYESLWNKYESLSNNSWRVIETPVPVTDEERIAYERSQVNNDPHAPAQVDGEQKQRAPGPWTRKDFEMTKRVRLLQDLEMVFGVVRSTYDRSGRS